MLPVARVGDLTIGTCTGHKDTLYNVRGKIITGANSDDVNMMGLAKLGDVVLADCGHTAKIITCSGSVYTDMMKIARVGDLVGASPYTGRIVTGESTGISD
jgi:uncharacterized Zn-binding protein involved in type VI secretion